VARYNVEGFTDQELDYYSRQIVLQGFGLGAQKKLKGSRVCVVGMGGLGSPITIQLASMGVGYLRIVDRDVVEMSNLQRQHLYGVDQVGLPKVEAAAERIGRLNPFIEVDAMPASLTPFNAGEIVEGMDVVLDSLDMMAPRYSLNRACVKQGIPLVHGAVLMTSGNASTIIPGETACLECFQGDIDDDALPTCAMVGVHPSIISIVASIMVSETVRIITGKKPLLADKLMFCDLEDLSFEKIQLRKVESCPVCGLEPRSEPSPIRHEDIEEICGREGRRVFVFTPDEGLDIDLEGVNEWLRSLNFSIDVAGSLGSTFSSDEGVKGSILKTGVIILEGVDDRDDAVELHDSLLQ